MEIVVDSCTILAVILGEPERDRVLELTTGHSLIAPGSVPWELGNAFSALLKRRRITLTEAKRGLQIYERIPLLIVGVDMDSAVTISDQARIYAYDAYFIDCALRHGAPLLTLDRRLQGVAGRMGARILEV